MSLRLYLVQHGQAMSEDENPDRPLTERGGAEVLAVAHHAVTALGVRPARVLHSGKTRARQTAEIWADQLGGQAEQADALAPNDDPTVWAGRAGASDDDLMLVGHLPHLGAVAGLLLTGAAGDAVVAFRPGTVVGLERDQHGWAVRLALPPPG